MSDIKENDELLRLLNIADMRIARMTLNNNEFYYDSLLELSKLKDFMVEIRSAISERVEEYEENCPDLSSFPNLRKSDLLL